MFITPNNISRCFLMAVICLTGSIADEAFAKTPDWLETLQNQAFPDYAPDVDAVILYDECRTMVTGKGEIKNYYRRVYKILSTEGKNLAWIQIPFDGETKISKFKAWNIKSDGYVHEVGEKEGFETQLLDVGNTLYSDTKTFILQIPHVEIDSLIAYEYERKHRPYILQDIWQFEGRYPVLNSRFELDLPSNWIFHYRMLNHPELNPQQSGENSWIWELSMLSGIPDEEGMPPVVAIAPMLAITFYPAKQDSSEPVFRTWDDFAHWYSRLIDPCLTLSTEINDMANRLGSVPALAEFVQKHIRYVAIEIGIGGYRPYFARQIIKSRFGDCKDKVTLLKSLNQAINKDIYLVLIHSNRRGFVYDFPSLMYFNHMIAAIPFDNQDLQGKSVVSHPELGQLLLFDPTDPDTPFGQLPASLQGTKALLISDNRAYEIETPLALPIYNRLLRTGQFTLAENGSLEGDMTEFYRGSLSRQESSLLRRTTHKEWFQSAQQFLSKWLPGSRLEKFNVGNLDTVDALTETYKFEAPFFGQPTGKLLLVHPCILGSKGYRLSAAKDRKYPFQFSSLRLDSDVFELTLPTGYVVEEVPEPLHVDHPFASYSASIEVKNNVLTYSRHMEIKQLSVPADQVRDLVAFYALINLNEQSIVVLKRISDEKDDNSVH